MQSHPQNPEAQKRNPPQMFEKLTQYVNVLRPSPFTRPFTGKMPAHVETDSLLSCTIDALQHC